MNVFSSGTLFGEGDIYLCGTHRMCAYTVRIIKLRQRWSHKHERETERTLHV